MGYKNGWRGSMAGVTIREFDGGLLISLSTSRRFNARCRQPACGAQKLQVGKHASETGGRLEKFSSRHGYNYWIDPSVLFHKTESRGSESERDFLGTRSDPLHLQIIRSIRSPPVA